MLRIHMSGVDLSKVRMATRPDALWETALSFHRLRDRRGSAVFGKWRTETRRRLNGEVRLLSAVIPPRGYFPDFLTPSQGNGEPYGIDAGMEALRGTPPARVMAELALLGAGRRDAGRLPDARAEPLGRLVGALRSYHRAAIEPYWPHIRASVEADRAVRGRALLDGGADELLASLPPMIRWRAPCWRRTTPSTGKSIWTGGGCCSSRPSSAASPRSSTATHGSRRSSSTRSPTPAPRSSPSRALARPPPRHHPVDGPERHRERLHDQRARPPGRGLLASASQHACVLREAGLIHTLRHGGSVLHTLTPLGGSLLRGGAPLALS